MAKTLQIGNSTLLTAQKLYEKDELDDAFSKCQDVLAETPDDPQALVLMAAILKRGEKTPIAIQLAEKATKICPNRPEPWVSYGHCAQHLWMLDKALESYQRALSLSRDDRQRATYLNNISSVYLDSGKFGEAEVWARRSMGVKDDPLTRHNLGLALLGQQKWAEGWPNYSASVGTFNRLKTKYNRPPNEEPVWDGTKGQRVVVYGEQGLGDEISFASMIPDVCKDARVVIDCDKRLKGLFERSFPEAKVYGTRFAKQLDWAAEDREIDASISIGELGKFYRNKPEDFTGNPYLKADPERAMGWRAIFDAKKKPVIGIAWTGGTWVNGSKNRSLPLDQWGPIFNSIDAHWVSLQYKDSSSEIVGTSVTQYAHATLTKDYDDTAALVSELDLVICMQTAVAHLAGALGVPVWVMVPENSQWRYGEATDALPWYRSLRIFKAKGDWRPVVNRIASELPNVFREKSTGSEVSREKGRKGLRRGSKGKRKANGVRHTGHPIQPAQLS